MSEAILVRGSDSTQGRIVSRVLAVVLLAAGAEVYFGFNEAIPGTILVALGGTVWVATGVAVARNNRRKRWITPIPEGFTLSTTTDRDDYRDTQVAGIAFATKDHFSGGVLKSVKRRILLWLDDEPAPVELITTIMAEQADPLEELIDRWIEHLKSRAREAIDRGGALEGDGWSLGSGTLAVAAGSRSDEIPLERIVDVGHFSGKLCLWQRGQDEASLKLDPQGRDVPILVLIIREILDAREEIPGSDEANAGAAGQRGQALSFDLPSGTEGGEQSEGSGLGRILFERRTQSAKILAGFFGVVSGGVGIYLLLSPSTMAIGVGLCVLAGLLALATVKIPPSVFRCHALGVMQSGVGRKKQIRYDAVDTFTYHAVRQFMNGVYTGTTLSMKFVAPDVTIQYNASLKNVDEDFDSLRDHIAAVIAARMGAQLGEGLPVRWTPALTLRPDGIDFEPSGFLGRKEPRFFAYSDVAGIDIQEGTFHLWATGSEKSVIQESISAPNFFPGFYFLTSLFSSDEAEQGDAGAEV